MRKLRYKILRNVSWDSTLDCWASKPELLTQGMAYLNLFDWLHLDRELYGKKDGKSLAVPIATILCLPPVLGNESEKRT